MKQGGDHYTDQSTRIARQVGVFATPLIAIYALLIVLDILPGTFFIHPALAMGIAILWVALSLFYFIKPAPAIADQRLRLVTYHVFAIALFVLVIGFDNPFSAFFVILFLASQLYSGVAGVVGSVGAFSVAIVVSTILRAADGPVGFLENGIVGVSVLFLGYAVLAILGAQETRRQALAHSQARERMQYERIVTIINNLTDAAFSTDHEGKILMYNAACLDLLDTNENLRGKTISDLFNLIGPDQKQVRLLDLLHHAKRAIRRDDIRHTYTDGETIRLEITYAPIRSGFQSVRSRGNQGGYILIMRDITKQKSLEEERDEFISVVSHELRTPLTIAEGSLSNVAVLLDKEKSAPEKLTSSVEAAHDQILYLAKMVNDLSTLSRAERGVGDSKETIDVSELMNSMHRQYRKEAEAKKLHLNIDLGPKLGTVEASRLYLEELLQNFVTNAIKYTREGSITLSAKRHKDSILFSVKDTGIGISRSDQAKVFEKFYRSEDYRIRETSGTGLGLYVSTKLAHKLHTRIELKSRLNHGSTFSFTLPVQQ